ncbi:oligopeptide ABC transporter substrate-binding protein [Spiroplasma helicoides]|uniref:Oligopeptide ABC transporter substrate-binding protein n=1 Tax=Spiroplasma helicoides TaxID=216938 RepID=A0A1B3SKJ5_9MOLU|nr:ABC transporter substrate-binding protein [Spiroplasma helicoides]AOG60459.1 oligopeptide ABC transporter substrate-binding protein [Spiroplasma helicoides]
MSSKNKKILSSLIGFSSIPLLSASVMSCGFNIQKVIDREMPDDTFISSFQYAPNSWTTAYTFQPINHKILSNTNATLLNVDEYGRLYGDIVESNPDLSQSMVGDLEGQSGFKHFAYTIRKNATWCKWDGSGQIPITADDFDTTAEFVMRSSVTQSQLTTIWNSFIRGAEELNTYLKFNPTSKWEDAKEKIKNDWSYIAYDGSQKTVKGVKEGFGLSFDKAKRKVIYDLSKAAPYFESLLCYAVFSPIHLDSRENMANVTDYKESYYSGAFLPNQINFQDVIILKKNPNYWFKDLVSINTIKYLYTTANATPSTERELFEAGNSSGFLINNGDDQGWYRYVGKNIDKPVFDYVYDAPTVDQVATSSLYINTYNTYIDKGTNSQRERAIKASKLLQNKLVRAWISTKLDRSVFIKYYSEKFDGGNNISKMIRNVYTAPGVGIDNNGKDYYRYVEDEVKKMVPSNQASEIQLSDGNDMYRDKTQLFTGSNDQEIMSLIKQFMISEDIIKKDGDKFSLEVLLNPEDLGTVNPRAMMMYGRFNEIEGNPIEINVMENVTTADDYMTKSTEGNFDLFNGIWWPDYADPATFLNTLIINGDDSAKTGTQRIFDYDPINNKYNVKSLVHTKTSISEEYANTYQSFNDNVIDIDHNQDDLEKRYQLFAQQEAKYLYKDFLVMPFYIKAAPKNYSVSYVIPYTTNYALSYGNAARKDVTKILSKKIVSFEEANRQKERVENYKTEISNDKKTQKKLDKNDRNHILFEN